MVQITLPKTQLLIDGDWSDAADGRSFTTINPATEAPIADVALGGAAYTEVAVHVAKRALDSGPWSGMTGAQRGRILYRLAAILRERMEEMVLLESPNAGKPLAATRRQDVAAAIDRLEDFAGWADKLAGEVIPVRNDALTFSRRAPVGVVAAIVPWNFPLMNAVWKTAPALACGCTVVLKPAQLTPLSARWLGQAALEAGVPPGVLNVVPGSGSIAGAALVSHSLVNKIAFTGSPEVGRGIMRAAAENVTHVGLELGGKRADRGVFGRQHRQGRGRYHRRGFLQCGPGLLGGDPGRGGGLGPRRICRAIDAAGAGAAHRGSAGGRHNVGPGHLAGRNGGHPQLHRYRPL